MAGAKQKYSRETVCAVVRDFKYLSIKQISDKHRIPDPSVRLILSREGVYSPPKPKSPSFLLGEIAEPDEWLRRVRSIPSCHIRNWVGSILYWDYAETPEASLFQEFTDAYEFDHQFGDVHLVTALASIGYPKPNKRIEGKYKGGVRNPSSTREGSWK